jgi:2-polyprenyl-3-methyl-5-hydroxy-6-metoxy-1,4-benzoquinol methylase
MPRVHDKYKDSPYFEDQRHFFDELITKDWDKYDSERWDRTRQMEVSRIFSIIRPIVGNRPISVLDVGCGCGYHDSALAEQSGVTRVVGIDYSAASIQQANTHYPHAKVERLVVDVFSSVAVSDLLTTHGSFDLVTSFQVIEHVPNPTELLAACARCARSSGYVAVVMPNRLRAQNLVRSLLGKELVSMDFLHYKEYTFDELTCLAAQAHLTPVGRFGHTFNLHKWKLGLSSVLIGTYLPRLADFIGMVFVKESMDNDLKESQSPTEI